MPSPKNQDISQLANTNKVDMVAESEADYSLNQLLHLIRLHRTNGHGHKLEKELRELTERQSHVRFLTNIRRVITLTGDGKQGEFKADIEEFQALLKQANESENEMLKKLLKEVGIVEGKKSYTKDEKTNVMESIKMTIDQLNVLNDMQIQTVSRLESENNEVYQMLMAAHKPLHNLITGMARSIKG